MDLFEYGVMRYVAADRSTLLIPQYDIENGWASLDFLGINSKRRLIYIIEVTTNADISSLLGKIESAFQPGKHVEKLKRQLSKDYAEQYDSWPVRAAVFVRADATDSFKKGLSPACAQLVDVFSLEDCTFPWEYWKRIVGADRSWDRPLPTD